jgi:RsiW-degrading membrane proteinase PrsW (M82 family)
MAFEDILTPVILVLLFGLVGFYVRNPTTEGTAPLIGSAVIGAIVVLQIVQLILVGRRSAE